MNPSNLSLQIQQQTNENRFSELNDADADGLCDELEVVGCSLDWADNYDSLATDFDDSICFRLGCTYNLADNFDSLATTDDGSCNLGDAYDAIVQAFAICQDVNEDLQGALDEFDANSARVLIPGF